MAKFVKQKQINFKKLKKNNNNKPGSPYPTTGYLQSDLKSVRGPYVKVISSGQELQCTGLSSEDFPMGEQSADFFIEAFLS